MRITSTQWRSTVVARLSVTLLAVVSVFDIGAAQAPASSSEWRNDWTGFVTAHNKCIQDPGCTRDQFLNQTVTWSGTAKSIDLAKGMVVMEMGGPAITDKEGTKAEILMFVIKPDSLQLAKWRDVPAGQRVRFRTKLTAGLTGSITGFMPLGGKATVMLFSEGAEYLGAATP